MSNPLVIIIISMAVTLVILVGLNILANKLDDSLQQRQAAVSLKRWQPVVRRINDNALEVIEFGSARYDQVPSLLLWGVFIVAILLAFPVPGQSLTFLFGKLGLVSAIIILMLLVMIGMRSRHTYYRIDLTSGKAQKQTRTFGKAGKTQNYLLALPVQASADCNYKDPDRKESFLKYATCWALKPRGKLRIVHRSSEEAEQFRADLARHGCTVLTPTVVSDG